MLKFCSTFCSMQVAFVGVVIVASSRMPLSQPMMAFTPKLIPSKTYVGVSFMLR